MFPSRLTCPGLTRGLLFTCEVSLAWFLNSVNIVQRFYFIVLLSDSEMSRMMHGWADIRAAGTIFGRFLLHFLLRFRAWMIKRRAAC
jgi:hypothetical protein